MGTTVSQLPSAPSQYLTEVGTVPALENGIRHGRYSEARTNGEWAAQPEDPAEGNNENHFNASGRVGMNQQYGAQGSTAQDASMIYDMDEQIAAAEAAHRQEQRGVSNLSHVASAMATNSGTNQVPLAQVSPSGGQVATVSQSGLGMSNPGAVLASGNQLGIEKRGPVEFNHAIGYVNKIKVCDTAWPQMDGYVDTDFPVRLDTHPNQTSTSLFLRFCRLTSESRSQSRMSMPK